MLFNKIIFPDFTYRVNFPGCLWINFQAWDPALQKSAQDWANHCTIEPSNTPNVGENRDMLSDNRTKMTLGKITIPLEQFAISFINQLITDIISDIVVGEWYDEGENHGFSPDNRYRIDVDQPVSNYTQVT